MIVLRATTSLSNSQRICWLKKLIEGNDMKKDLHCSIVISKYRHPFRIVTTNKGGRYRCGTFLSAKWFMPPLDFGYFFVILLNRIVCKPKRRLSEPAFGDFHLACLICLLE